MLHTLLADNAIAVAALVLSTTVILLQLRGTDKKRQPRAVFLYDGG